MKRAALPTIILLLLFQSTAFAEFYRWVDKDGREFVTNEREKIPKEYRASATAVQIDDARVSIGKEGSAPVMRSTASNEHKDKYGRGEEHWRKRASKLRKELAALQDKYDAIQKQNRDEEHKLEARPAKSGSNKKRTARQKKITALEKDVARKKHELDVELPEEARKADAYPGWIRE